MNKDARIFVAGHRGLVGGALVRVLRAHGYDNIITASHAEADLTDACAVDRLFAHEKPEYVFLAAARVGGIIANSTKPVEFMVQNLRIQDNVLECSKIYGVKKLLFLGSACAYPKCAPAPVKEAALLTGPLEPSNECYALAKISGIKLCQAYRKEYGCDFISVMPTNLYGIGDHYDLETSHVIPGMLHRFHDAKTKTGECWLWGTGRPIRQFLFADDLAEACLLLMQIYSGDIPHNIGPEDWHMLEDLAYRIRSIVGFWGAGGWDRTKPDGTPDRRLDVSRIYAMGWKPKVSLDDGLTRAYQDFLCQQH